MSYDKIDTITKELIYTSIHDMILNTISEEVLLEVEAKLFE